LSADRPSEILKKAGSAFSEDACLALFSVVALDDAYAAERFGKTAGDLGVDAGALSEKWACDPKYLLQEPTEGNDDTEGKACHESADVAENDEHDDPGENSTDKVQKAGPDKVSHSFYVCHDTSDKGTGTVLVVEGDRQAADVLLDLHSKLSDEALTGNA
jgi:hypothetical protein